jgi:hypothetical protein
MIECLLFLVQNSLRTYVAQEDLDLTVEYAAAAAVADQILEDDEWDYFVASLNDYCSLLGVPWVLPTVGFH